MPIKSVDQGNPDQEKCQQSQAHEVGTPENKTMMPSATNRYGSCQQQDSDVVTDESSLSSFGAENEEQQLLLPTHRQPRRSRAVSNKVAWLMVLAAVAASAIFYMGVRMTSREEEIAWLNDLPPYAWATRRKIRVAQKIADAGQARLLAGFAFRGWGGGGGGKPSATDDDDDDDDNNDQDDANSDKSGDSGHNKSDDIVHVHKDKKRLHNGGGGAPAGCEATIIIIRHCEKGSVREHCAFVGYERSVYLATLFGDGNERWPAPSSIYALSPGGRHNKQKMNFREIETVGVVSEKVSVPVDYSYSTKHTNRLADLLLERLRDGELCGKVVLVSWKHSNIPHLARHLGCGPNQGCPLDYHGKTFDEAWQIKFVYREFGHSAHKSLKLPRSPEWKIFGSTQPEGFDPLAFSKLMGDYPGHGSGGKAHPGWEPDATEIAERKSYKDTDDWATADNVDFLAMPHDV